MEKDVVLITGNEWLRHRPLPDYYIPLDRTHTLSKLQEKGGIFSGVFKKTKLLGAKSQVRFNFMNDKFQPKKLRILFEGYFLDK